MLDEYGDEIEADLLREYNVDVLDFYRGKLSPRRLGVLVRELSADSSLSRAQNDGQPPWSMRDHLLADLWIVLVKILTGNKKDFDHPRRVAMEAKRQAAARQARTSRLRSRFERRKKTYGLG